MHARALKAFPSAHPGRVPTFPRFRKLRSVLSYCPIVLNRRLVVSARRTQGPLLLEACGKLLWHFELYAVRYEFDPFSYIKFDLKGEASMI